MHETVHGCRFLLLCVLFDAERIILHVSPDTRNGKKTCRPDGSEKNRFSSVLRLHETLPYGMAPAPIPEQQRLCFLSPAFFLLQVLRLLQRLQRFQPADVPAEQIQQGQLPQPMHPPSLRPNCFQRQHRMMRASFSGRLKQILSPSSRQILQQFRTRRVCSSCLKAPTPLLLLRKAS